MTRVVDLATKDHPNGGAGIYSVCTAHPLVIEAAMRHSASRGNGQLVIEATSNQVNQDGGYTGMTPKGFVTYVKEIAQRADFPFSRIVLGGDHLGPNAWQSETPSVAMEKAGVMIAQYVAAGFRKIHLDCSMSCAGDPVPLSDDVVAQRAAVLCAVAEEQYEKSPNGPAPVYVIGTEVPVPGGATEDLDELAVTTTDDAQHTIRIHKEIFEQHGLSSAWSRVIALVVQPGVEFDHHTIVEYDSTKTGELTALLSEHGNLVYEAHSTDYQTTDALAALVKNRFAILKVGPGVTFALREALWGLDSIEREMYGDDASGFKDIVLKVMHNNPKYWDKYYLDKTPAALSLDLQFSLSDRIRYYWPDTEIETARGKMFSNLSARTPVPELISQFLPTAYRRMRNGECGTTPEELAMAVIYDVLDDYYDACNAT